MHKLLETDVIKKIKSALSNATETSQIEFKDGRGGIPTDIWKALSAFSNTPGGGMIVLGVEEDKISRKYKVVGGLDLHTLQEKVFEYINNKLSNCGPYTMKIVELNGKSLLVIAVSEIANESKPCYNLGFGMPKGAYIRVGNVNKQMSEDQLREILRYTPEYKFDKRPLFESNLDSLSIDKIKSFLEKSSQRKGRNTGAVSDLNKVMRNLSIIVESDPGKYLPSLAGVLIFAKNSPQETLGLERYFIRCVRYAGKSASTDIIDQQEIYGTLDRQIEDTLAFIKRNIKQKVFIKNAKRFTQAEYPIEALREIVANAVIHRDYIITGTYTQVSVYSDRIEVTNAGTLPPGITIENLIESQFSRNETIANIMRDLDYMEEYGRGIDLVYARMSEYGLVEPLFKNASNMFKVTLLSDTYSTLNERQIKIWNFLQENSKASVLSIQKNLFPKAGRSTINKDLKKMVEMELIASQGISNNTYYEPKY